MAVIYYKSFALFRTSKVELRCSSKLEVVMSCGSQVRTTMLYGIDIIWGYDYGCQDPIMVTSIAWSSLPRTPDWTICS